MKRSNSKILIAAVVLLLIANIALVAMMLNRKGKSPGKRTKMDTSEMMAKELGMTDEQKKQHKAFKEEHFKNMRPYFDSLKAAKAAFFALAKDSAVSDSTITAYSNRITEQQATIDRRTLAHFKRLRSIFTAEQQPKFDAFLQKMMNRGKKDSADKK